MKNYYRLATEVDSTCGKVLDELKKQGVLDNTLVIFTTDNGYYHAEHGLADKWYPHQESIRVPLIIRDPRMPEQQHGSTNNDFTLSVDLAPTILSAVGLATPEAMQGRDIAPLYLADKKPVVAQRVFLRAPLHQGQNLHPRVRGPGTQGLEIHLLASAPGRATFRPQSRPTRGKRPRPARRAQHRCLNEMRQRFKELKLLSK